MAINLRGMLALMCAVTVLDFERSVTALSLQSMDENCILSFVVPREKMKSSCDVGDKVKRKLNVVEMKVNVYKQQLSELQIQLSKERQLNAQKADQLERLVRENSLTADSNNHIERRIALLERELGQLSNEIVQGRSAQKTARPAYVDHESNAVDSNPVVLPNLVKSMVESELQIAFEDFTKKIETYVHEQILLYGQVFNMISKPQDATTPPDKSNSHDNSMINDQMKHDKYEERQKDGFSENVMNHLSKVNKDIDKIGEEIVDKVSSYLHKPTETKSSDKTRRKNTGKHRPNENTVTTISSTTYETSTSKDSSTTGLNADSYKNNNSTTSDYDGPPLLNSSELVLTEDTILNVNDSFSGDNSDKNDTEPKQVFTSKAVNKEIPGGASSRISNSPGKDLAEPVGEDGEENHWKENMVMDEKYDKAKAEAKLKEEVKSLLYKPLAEVMSLVKKQTTEMADQVREQEEFSHSIIKDFNVRMKLLDKGIESNSLQLDSISQAVQEFYAKTETMKSIEANINELKKNISASQSNVPVALNEQGKRVKKLERLMRVYQQSLDHYKNETKLEYKEMRETLLKELLKLKLVSKSLKKEITGSVHKIIDGYNDSLSLHSSQMAELKEDMKNADENVLLINIDLKNLERKVNSKNNKVEREMNDIRENVDVFLSKSRDFKKEANSMNRRYSALDSKLNATSKLMEDLKTEVKLTTTDDWLEIDFFYDGSRSGCYGKQYLRRTKFRKASFVGVVLCSPERYKIYLSDSLESKFLNIGDGDGFGEDHCEFVGGSKKDKINLAPFKPSYGSDRGYTRNSWGQEPRISMINAMKPTPKWYECGVTIP